MQTLDVSVNWPVGLDRKDREGQSQNYQSISMFMSYNQATKGFLHLST